jgi:ABC-2 type transport system permease protein
MFLSPIAYIVITVFLIVTGWFFFSTFFLVGRADMRQFFSLLPIVFTFTLPAITMRLFSEEYKTGSYEMLGTLPVSPANIILGKYLSVVATVGIMLLATISYPLFIQGLGDLDIGPVVGGYIGALLLGSSYAAIGLFASSLSSNQIVAFIISVVICFSLTMVDKMLILLPDALTNFLQFLSSSYHFDTIAKGILDSRDLIYFISVAVIALFGTYYVNYERK